MRGCQQTATASLNAAGYCDCLFTKLTSAPPYDTPQTFAVLDAAVLRARRLQDLPPELIAAARSCVTGAAPSA